MPRTIYNHLATPKKLVGVVISTAMDRTAVVAVQRFYQHPRTRKVMSHITKFFCHDHHELCGVGDRVQIDHWGPISRKKSHVIVDIVERHPQLDGEPFPMSALVKPPVSPQMA